MPPPTDALPAYTLDIALNYADRRLDVVQRIAITNHSPDVWDEVVFAVSSAYKPDVFELHFTRVATTNAERWTRAVMSRTMLHIPLPYPLAPGGATQVILDYTIHIPPVAPTDWLPLGNLGAGEHLIQAGDWHPTLVPYVPGHGWHTWRYHPVGDPTIYAVGNYTVRIRSTAPIVIAAPGETTHTRDVRHYEVPAARCFAFLASPEYRFFARKVADVPVRIYYLPDFADAALEILATIEKGLPLFEEYYGHYPFTGLIVAQNDYVGAMEYSGLISMSRYAFETYAGDAHSGLVTLTAHELAHQWWYGAVGNNQVTEAWLDESFAKYSEFLFYERYAPDYAPQWWEVHIARREANASLNSSIYEFESTAAFIREVYTQGARFMADLRTLMGDRAFFAFVRDYQRQHRGGMVIAADFFEAVRAHTRQDIAPLIEQYFGY